MGLKQLFIASSLALTLGCAEKKTEDGPSRHDLSFQLKDFSPHLKHQITVALYDRDARKAVTTKTLSVEDDGTVKFQFESSLADKGFYNIAYYADVDADEECDAPPTDHGWVVKLDQISGAKDLEDTHRMSFSNPCFAFETSKTSKTSNTISGTLSLGSKIESDSLVAGQSLKGATVFLEGYPEQEAVTDEKGAFTLAIDAGASLADDDPRLFMWYTETDTDDPKSAWSKAKARYGMAQSISLSQEKIDVGSIELIHTSGIRFNVVNSQGERVPMCWINPTTIGFQLVSNEIEAGRYELEYLPAGTYTVTLKCSGYKTLEAAVEVPEATKSSSWKELEDIVVEKEESDSN